jgi:hypothetical protein
VKSVRKRSAKRNNKRRIDKCANRKRSKHVSTPSKLNAKSMPASNARLTKRRLRSAANLLLSVLRSSVNKRRIMPKKMPSAQKKLLQLKLRE